MAIMVRCQCGKQLRARDSSAGKRVKCSACGGPVRVPASGGSAGLYDDDYGVQDDYEDKYGPNPYADTPPRRTGSKQKAKGKAKKSAGGSWLPLIFAGAAIAGVLVIGGILFSVLKPDDGAAADVAGVDGVSDSGEPNASVAQNGNDSGAAAPIVDADAELAAAQAQLEAAKAEMEAAQQQNKAAREKIQQEFEARMAEANRQAAEQQAAAGTAPTQSPAAAEVPETIWVVLSNFRQQQGDGGLSVTLSVDYRVVAGQPIPNRNYVLFVGSSIGMMTRYQEVELNLANTSGTVAVPVSVSFQNPTARVARKRGRNDWEPVSGEIEIGGSPTAAQRPPTVLEAAGTDAQGKLLAIANARFENSRMGRQALVIDFVMQKPFDPGFQYLMVITGQGEPMRTRITTSLIQATVGKSDQMGVQPLGAGFPAGDLKVHIEKVLSPFSRDTPEIVSNTVSVRR